MKLSINRYNSLNPLNHTSPTSPSDSVLAFKLPVNHQKSSKKQRINQLKLLLMISIIKLYKKQYHNKITYDQCFITSTSKEHQKLTFLCYQSMQKTIVSKLLRTKRQKQNIGELKSRIGERGGLKSMIGDRSCDVLKSIRSACQYQHQSLQFQKLNNLIDKFDVSSTIRKSLQYLKTLKQLCQKTKLIIFKYYKSLIKISNQSKLSKIQQYIDVIINLFKTITSMLGLLLDKDQNWQKHVKNCRILQKKMKKDQTIFQRLQNLLFYFSCFYTTRQIYQKFPKLKQVAYYNIPLIKKIINSIIKLRHVLGYLSKQMINVSLIYNKQDKNKDSNKDKYSGKQEGGLSFNDDVIMNKMVWMTIYQRKYQTNHFKNRLKLQ